METQEQQFTKGFNNGYLLAKYEPTLANQLTNNKNENSEYFKGLVSGKKEHDIEKVRNQLKNISPSNNQIREVKNKGKER